MTTSADAEGQVFIAEMSLEGQRRVQQVAAIQEVEAVSFR